MAFFNDATVGHDTRIGPLFEANQFVGFGTGSDRLTGGILNDVFVMSVDTATDAINGGAGTDRIDYGSSNRGLTIVLDNGAGAGSVTSKFVTGFQQTPFGTLPVYETKTVATLTSIEDVVGSSLGDSITGNGVANRLDGGAGNDWLFGGAGDDTLIGGCGSDTFAFASVSDVSLTNGAGDHIVDFERGVDRIDLSAIDANVIIPGNQSFVIVDEFTGHAGELMAFPEFHGTGQAWVMDVNGDGVGDGRIMVHTTDGLGTLLTVSDFIL